MTVAADQTTRAAERQTVELWFDPKCPWAWMTSRWLVEVSHHREIDLRLRVLSLVLVNEGREVSEHHRRTLMGACGLARVLTAASVKEGEDQLLPLYSALGHRIHVQGRTPDTALVEEALEEVGLPVELSAAQESDEHDDLLRATHAEALERFGDGPGTPMLSLAGATFFGPVVTPAPKGEDALRLWDGLSLVASVPGFYELKRSRSVGPDFS